MVLLSPESYSAHPGGGFKESVILFLDGVPHNIDFMHLQQDLLRINNVEDVHHIHIWAMSTTENALTAHVKLRNIDLLESTRRELKEFLKQQHITHSTLEFESKKCCDCNCC